MPKAWRDAGLQAPVVLTTREISGRTYLSFAITSMNIEHKAYMAGFMSSGCQFKNVYEAEESFVCHLSRHIKNYLNNTNSFSWQSRCRLIINLFVAVKSS
jgi:hypothetical protein